MESMRSRLLELLDHARTEVVSMVGSRDEAQRAEVGTLEHWSAKDTVAHITAWQGTLARILDHQARGEQLPDPWAQMDAENVRLFGENRQRAWPDVLGEAEQTYQGMLAQVSRLTEEDLMKPDDFAWRGGRPLWQTIAGNSYTHPRAHVAHFYVQRGDLARATSIHEEIATEMSQLDGTSRGYAVAHYNLACFYAQTTRPEQAVEYLREAFDQVPDLVEWARQDADLAPLHDRPEYQALFALYPRDS